MKRFFLFLVVAGFLISSLGAGLAEETKEKCPMKDKSAKQGKMMMGKMQGMTGMMAAKQMVAVKDGGVIVLTGNKLLKYDQDLNLIKEVEIKMDMKMMHENWQHMKEKCSKDKKMMDKDESVEETPAQEPGE